MGMAAACLFIGIGVCLLAVGYCLSDPHVSAPTPFWTALLEGIGILELCEGLRRTWANWRGDRDIRRLQHTASPLAVELSPQLFGDYTPYVLDAARTLGEERDVTAVPSLVRALETCVDAQRPGWRERAEGLANSLAMIGDRRALPLLYRLENVRGIGLIPAIRGAIMVIEPHSSLLRPGNLDPSTQEMLLRPAHGVRGEDEPQLMLRAAEPRDK